MNNIRTGIPELEQARQELGRDHRLALQTLLAFDPRIRCAVEVRLDGVEIASVSRKDLEPLEPVEKTGKVLEQIAIGTGVGSSMDGYHGRVRAVIVVREKVSLIVFPLFDSLILLSADPEFPLQKTRQMARLLDTGTSCSQEVEKSIAIQDSCPTYRELRANMF